MKKVAIYTRVSTTKQAKEGKTSLDEQERLCREWLDKIGGCELVGVFVDGGAGGIYRSRPAMDEIMALARDQKINAVLVGKADRWARDTAIANILRYDLNDYGCELLLVDRDLTTNEGRLLNDIETNFAAYERDKITERLHTNLRAHLKKGDFIGSGFAPYGYFYSKDLKNLVIDSAESAWVLNIFEWISEGISMQKVADKLNGFGVPTKRNGKNGWVAATIKQLLDNPVYKGEFAFFKTEASVRIGSVAIGVAREKKTSHTKRDRSEWITIPVTPIVSPELWQVCQEIRQTNKKISNRNMKLDYLLRAGLLRCYCGYFYHGTTSHDRRVYRCNGIKPSSIAKTGHRCDAPSIRADEIETRLWNAIIARLERISDPAALFDDDFQQKEIERNKTLAFLEMAMKQENDINDESLKLVNLYTKGVINEFVYESKYHDLEVRRAACIALKTELQEQLKDVSIKVDSEALEQLSAGASKMLDYSHDQKRSILELLQTKITVNKDGSADMQDLITDHLLLAMDFYSDLQEEFESGDVYSENGKLTAEELADFLENEFEDPIYGNTVWKSEDLQHIETVTQDVRTYKKT